MEDGFANTGDGPHNMLAPSPSFHFLGIRVNTLTVSDLNNIVAEQMASGSQVVIACHNLHSLYIFHHDERMRTFHKRADYVHIDGMGVLILGCLLGHPLRREHRVTYLDWLKPLFYEAQSKKWRVFYIGMRASICQKTREIISRDFENLAFRTAHWDIEHVAEEQLRNSVVTEINNFEPHILLVGLGQPRQEHWILNNRERVSANVILPCGAAMDYVAGAATAPPRWAGRYGIEWLFRLITEPRHLWRRYLIEPWYVLRLLYAELFFSRVKSE
jgi:N-acetylglucosaminyldiphosphoundecaprenol N-acetyl-beta-D-mannosaminyltransferase